MVELRRIEGGAGRGSGADGGEPELPGWSKGLFWAVPVLLALVLLLTGLDRLASFLADWLWFGAVDHRSVLVKILTTRAWLWLAGFATVAAIAGTSGLFAVRAAVADSSDGLLTLWGRRLLQWGTALAIAMVGTFFGSLVSEEWDMILRWLHAAPFGEADAVFDRDIGFYVFTLPALQSIRGWLLGIVVVSLLLTAGIHALAAQLQDRTLAFAGAMRRQLTTLVALAFLLVAWGQWLARYDLLFSPSGAVFGVGYTEANALLPARTVLSVIAVLCGISVFVAGFRTGRRSIVGTVVAWVVFALLGGTLLPGAVQRFRVEPSELARETPYLADHIESTRRAYALDRIRSRSHPARGEVGGRTIVENPGTVANVRLWDEGPLLDSYNQIQFFRLYYDFREVSTDRYRVGDQLRQVMLSTRELSPAKLPEEAQRWVNRRLQFTHGYGAAISPVTEVASDGRPAFLLKDVPPVGEIPLEKPEVYYGLESLDFVITNSRMQEFNYPGPEGPVYTHYEGTGGVELSSFFRKLLYAWTFRDVNILITGEIAPDSRIQYRREVRERISTITPYLRRDREVYPVVADGRLHWILDAYTITNRYPYSQPWNEDINYIRNSVKAVVDAYDGTVDYYVSDPDDPILRAYTSIFPGVFRPLDEMPESLRSHLRYPVDYFTIQVRTLLQYQMEDPVVFYNKEDQWSLPVGTSFGETSVLRPYYVVSRLPGEAAEEFLLIQPFTPDRRHNLVAWIAARNDGDGYGELVLYRFPSGRHVDGPNQVGARIDNDPVISEQFTLWGQVGSEVSRGLLLVIPVGDSILYAQPVFLQPETLEFPELRRIILADSRRVVMQPTMERAVAALVGELPAIAERGQLVEVRDEPDARSDSALADEDRPARAAPPDDGTGPSRAELQQLARELEEGLAVLESVLEEMRRLSREDDEGSAAEDPGPG